uniref:Uncharacterized protein n=1 Tax=Anopheles minimus TaxID=112268 RepID=A0A182WNZ3_9DIPT
MPHCSSRASSSRLRAVGRSWSKFPRKATPIDLSLNPRRCAPVRCQPIPSYMLPVPIRKLE